MPLYEYECANCHRRTEKIQKFSDPELTVCPFCGGVLARTITAPAIQFKGAGWYKDLYSSAKPPAATGSGEGASGSNASGEGAATGKSDAGSTSGTKSDAAPAASPAPAAPSAPSSSGASKS